MVLLIAEQKEKFRGAEYLPLCHQKQTSDASEFQSFCVKLTAVEGLKDQDVCEGGRFQYQICLYDYIYQQFVGNVWKGKIIDLKNGKITSNEKVYFYTSVTGKELMLIIEITVYDQSKVARTVAWAELPLFQIQEKFISQHSVNHRISLHYGTPLVLFFMGSSLESINFGEDDNELKLSLSISSCPLLMRFIHLVPENFLFCLSSDAIPGISQVPGHVSSSKPQLQHCSTYILGNIVIKIHPDLSSMENDILQKVSVEGEMLSTLQHKGMVSIAQRRLQIGIHNGLCYIQEPDTYNLVVEPVVQVDQRETTSLKCESSLGTLSFSREECLIVRSDIKIPNVPEDQHIMFIFLIEYLLSFENSTFQVPSGSSVERNSTTAVTIFWGFCSLSDIQERTSFAFSMISSPTLYPNKTLILQTSDLHECQVSFTNLTNMNKGEAPIISPSSERTVKESTMSDSLTTKNFVASSVPSTSHHTEDDQIIYQQNNLLNMKRRMKNGSDYQDSASEIYEKNAAATAFKTMEEVAVIPSSLPFITSPFPTVANSPCHFRNFRDDLESVNFIPIYDHQGKLPVEIDVSRPYLINEKKEITGPPHEIEIIFQFLAVSISESVAEYVDNSKAFFLCFQFYHFPPIRTERLLLKPENAEKPFYVFVPGESNNNEMYGYQVTFAVDPSELKSGEYESFLLFLVNQYVQVDIIDAESLLYFGTAMLPLKYFCTQGRSSVCASLELEIIHCEFPDDSPGPPVPNHHIQKGQLNIRLASIKAPLSAEALNKLNGNTIIKASPVLETNEELAQLLSSRCALEITKESQQNSFDNRSKKLARMKAVRNLQGQAAPFSLLNSDIDFIKKREDDLLIIESYIEKNKSAMISAFLEKSVTAEKYIYPAVGEKYYFEHLLENPLQADQKISIIYETSELDIITDRGELNWLYKKLNSSVKFKPEYFSETNSGYIILLHPKEAMHIPFAYQHINTLTTASYMKTFSGHCYTSQHLKKVHDMISYSLKVYFYTEDQVLLSLLHLKIQPVPPSANQVFKFLSPESSVFEKTIRLSEQLSETCYLHCSDSEIAYKVFLQDKLDSKTFDIYIKAPSGPVGKQRIFYLFLYKDPHFSVLLQTWKIIILSVHKLSLSCVAGHLTKSSLLLRASQSTHLVKCFSDSPQLLIHPNDAFILTSCTVQEINVSVRCLLPGVGYFRVTAVDQDLYEILQSWLIILTCQKPTVTKAFQVHLSAGKESLKRITYKNHTSNTKQCLLMCSHPHLLYFKEKRFSVSSQSSYSIGLYFPPQDFIISETVFVYVSNDNEQNDETYCIKINCK